MYVTTHLLTVAFGRRHVTLEKFITHIFPSKFANKTVLLYKRHLRDYIQLYSQFYLSDFFYNTSFPRTTFSLRKVNSFY